MKKKNIAILGSTGSIGTSTLDVIKKDNLFNVYLLAANNNYKIINAQIKIFNPSIVIINNNFIYKKIKQKFKNKKKFKIYNNYFFLKNIKKKIDYTVSAIPGIAGLEPTLKFISISKKILLANKESIICGWNLIKKESLKYKTKLIPIDSEHYALAELTKNYTIKEIDKVYLTASGGPFLKLPFKNLKKVNSYDAIKHPKWKMGKKISIDSATLVNKVLEISEALKIFPFKLNQYQILIHPESLVHAIIKLKNEMSLFLYHKPDMKILIADALNSKSFVNSNKKKIHQIKQLNFSAVDLKKFPIVRMIPKINFNNSSLIIFNAINEIFVDQFLNNKIDFLDISRYLHIIINSKKFIELSKMNSNTLANIIKIDFVARKIALKIIKK